MTPEPAKETEERQATQNRLRRLIESGVTISGASASGFAGAMIGTVIGGPPGAALGGVAGHLAAQALHRIGDEISRRFLSPREEMRVGCVYALAAKEIVERQESGEQVRNDGFFDQDHTGRADAEEAWENVLLKSQRETEEKKLPYMAHLLASTAFHPDVSAPMAHQIIKTAEQLTYRQLCILRISAGPEGLAIPKGNFRGYGSFPHELSQILYEYLDLYHRGYINFGGEVAFGPTDVEPGNTTVQGMGARMFNMMSLGGIPHEDTLPITTILRRFPPPTPNDQSTQ